MDCQGKTQSTNDRFLADPPVARLGRSDRERPAHMLCSLTAVVSLCIDLEDANLSEFEAIEIEG